MKQDEETQPERKHRPCFQGQRFVVHDWQLENLRRLLGPLADGFDLFGWFETLDNHADLEAIVIPQRDGGVWLMARTLEEAVRRGLPIVTAESLRKQEKALADKARLDRIGTWTIQDCRHTPRHSARHACMIQSTLESARTSREVGEEG